ncbi:MAG: efflux RND transporter periplasmic adaptor subunit [Deltaproteobacteria bacterium]|nr:efflux RND transporter periplasmic adaptor subunit [Deltaproteobacteria bacterium]
MLIRMLALALALASLSLACADAAPPEPPPLEVSVAQVLQRDQPIQLEMVGETRGSADIPIRARVEGVILGMHFTEGRRVEKGDLLYTIEPNPFEAKVVEAKGYRAEARTKLAKAKSDLDRIRPLAEMRAVSQIDLDGANAQYEAALGGIQVADARLVQAEIELGYTLIHAPISGRIGITEAKVGEFVGQSPNPVVLNFVSRTDPIRVRFSIDERRYLQLARRIRELGDDEIRADSGPDLELILADGTVHEHPGRTSAVDAAINPKTGTFTLEADFPNPDGLVLAGQFARVRAAVETRKDALLVPQRAISELQGIFRVYVISEDGNVGLRAVELGPKIDKLQIVEKGLAPGDMIAIEIARLRPKMTVRPKLVRLADDGNVIEEPAPSSDRMEDKEAGGA